MILEKKAQEVGRRMKETYKIESLTSINEYGEVSFIDPLTLIALISLFITIGKTIYDCWVQHHPSKPVTFAEYLNIVSHASLLQRVDLRLIVAKHCSKGLLSPHVSELTYAILDIGHDMTKEETEEYANVIVV